jgi:hypothetical protein
MPKPLVNLLLHAFSFFLFFILEKKTRTTMKKNQWIGKSTEISGAVSTNEKNPRNAQDSKCVTFMHPKQCERSLDFVEECCHCWLPFLFSFIFFCLFVCFILVSRSLYGAYAGRNPWSSCLSLPSAGITGATQHLTMLFSSIIVSFPKFNFALE